MTWVGSNPSEETFFETSGRFVRCYQESNWFARKPLFFGIGYKIVLKEIQVCQALWYFQFRDNNMHTLRYAMACDFTQVPRNASQFPASLHQAFPHSHGNLCTKASLEIQRVVTMVVTCPVSQLDKDEWWERKSVIRISFGLIAKEAKEISSQSSVSELLWFFSTSISLTPWSPSFCPRFSTQASMGQVQWLFWLLRVGKDLWLKKKRAMLEESRLICWLFCGFSFL